MSEKLRFNCVESRNGLVLISDNGLLVTAERSTDQLSKIVVTAYSRVVDTESTEYQSVELLKYLSSEPMVINSYFECDFTGIGVMAAIYRGLNGDSGPALATMSKSVDLVFDPSLYPDVLDSVIDAEDEILLVARHTSKFITPPLVQFNRAQLDDLIEKYRPILADAPDSVWSVNVNDEVEYQFIDENGSEWLPCPDNSYDWTLDSIEVGRRGLVVKMHDDSDEPSELWCDYQSFLSCFVNH
ncbi:hypothetical protein [Photobacterium leiognathi]|uniref:hypothetical protein n=1 Tax=Photobacterium leiognathi TaxID=553611 RepID=UPI002980CBFE|nr:hypothetical protein [Photobacterium leiognathi]